MPNLAANLTIALRRGAVSGPVRTGSPPDSKGRVPVSVRPPGSALKQKLRDHGLAQVLHNLPAGNWAGGERGVACLPDQVDEFKAGIKLIETINTRDLPGSSSARPVRPSSGVVRCDCFEFNER
jgi:hypothetical protein